MPYACDRPHFTVTVTSGFISDRQWAVHAVVEYRTLGLDGIPKRIETEARLEMMIGISRDSQLGRDRGARSVVVVAEGDREIAGLLGGLDPRNSDTSTPIPA